MSLFGIIPSAILSKKVELKSDDIIFLKYSGMLSHDDIDKIEANLFKKTGMKCIVLDNRYTDICRV